MKRNYPVNEIKAWRKKQYDQGKPSSLKSFYIAHGLCPDCRGRGTRIRFMGETDRIDSFVDCPSCNGTGDAMQAEYQKALRYAAFPMFIADFADELAELEGGK